MINVIPSDVQYFGTFTGRTSGMITTLPSPSSKKPRKLGATIKNHLHWAPNGFDAVGFDFSALELVVAAAVDAAEYCQRNGLALDPLVREAGRLVFLGSSAAGTDVHTVVSKQIGIPRKTTKTIEYSPLGAECLVNVKSKGWISISEVLEGDLVEAQDLSNMARVWTPVLKTFAYPQHSALSVKVGKLSFTTTHDHRWPAFAARGSKSFKGYKTTSELGGEDCLRTSFVPQAKNFPSRAQSLLTEDEARLLGWLVTDGSWQTYLPNSSNGNNNKGGSYSGSIVQSKPKQIADISRLLARLGLPCNPVPKKQNKLSKLDCYAFPISGKVLRPLFEKITGNSNLVFKKSFSLSSVISQLSLPALRALLATIIKAEGNCSKDGKNSLTIVQSTSSPIHNDIEHLANLCGFSVNVATRVNKPGELTRHPYSSFILHKRKTISWQRVTKTPVVADVFCITTPTSNFWTKINGQQVLSGNCLYGSGQKGIESVARPELPDYDPERLSTMAGDFLRYFKGQKIRGTPYYEDGLFSHFFNGAFGIISSPTPRLPYLGTAITTALRPEAVGKEYLPGRMNWVCQAMGGELHDTVLVLVQRAARAAGLTPRDFRFYVSVHD